MNLQETLQLLDKLHSVGVTRFKSGELELDLRGPLNVADANKPVIPPLPQQPETEQYNAENTKKAEALIDLLKRKDDEILNHIFPEGA